MSKCPNCKFDLIERYIDPEGVLHCPKCAYNYDEKNKNAEFIYALLFKDENGVESIVGTTQFGVAMPVVSTSKLMVEQCYTKELKEELNSEAIIATFKRVEEYD